MFNRLVDITHRDVAGLRSEPTICCGVIILNTVARASQTNVVTNHLGILLQ